MSCECARGFSVRVGRTSRRDYDQMKRLLNRGRHPTFIGPSLVLRCARNGGLWFYDLCHEPMAVSVVNPKLNVLLVLNVLPAHRSHGLGRAIVECLRPTWVRSVRHATNWFERLGYVRVAQPKQGRTLITDLLVDARLLSLAGRLRESFDSERINRLLGPHPTASQRVLCVMTTRESGGAPEIGNAEHGLPCENGNTHDL